MSVRAFVALGDLAPDDVDVQLVHGRINSEDELTDIRRRRRCTSPRPTRAAGTGSTATSSSTTAAPFGYTVRVIPRNDLLTSPAELGVVALP